MDPESEPEEISNLFGDDDTSEDQTYEPPDTPLDESDFSDDSESEAGPAPKRPKHPGRKKTRRPHLWIKNLTKQKRNEGKAYTDRKGKQHQAKQVRPYIHNCRYNYNTEVNEEQRETLFKEYWGLGKWELQTSFLSASITLKEPVRKKKHGPKSKTVTCELQIFGHRVCKQFLLRTLDISNKRLSNVINKKANNSTGISPRDNRGNKTPPNKIPPQVIELIKEHISSFPRYSSHYSRTSNPNRKYLRGDLSIAKTYGLYKEYCEEKEVEPVQEAYCRHIFNTCFNLSFHKPHTDTCDTCDKLQNVIDHGSLEEKNKSGVAKELHLRKAENAREQVKLAKVDVMLDPHKTVAICFDVQKTLPSPVLTCSKVYYSRQLWTYNFCIHNLHSGNASMYLWNEAIASRGCAEILSCLLKFIKTMPPDVKKLTAFSDNAGGQNKSRFTVKFWLYVVRNTQIEEVNHKYLLSGHSYNDCDKNFGVVEKAKRRQNTGIFVPADWCNLIAKSSKRFIVKQMEVDDFVNVASLDDCPFVKNVTGIRSIQWLKFKKNEPWSLFYKNTFNQDMPFSVYNMRAATTGRPSTTMPDLKKKTTVSGIKKKKYEDLLGLLPYVPPVHHDFYRSLPITQGTQVQTQENVEDGAMDSDYD